ncbi:hypothetical protein [Streptomyces sp. NPDC002644]
MVQTVKLVSLIEVNGNYAPHVVDIAHVVEDPDGTYRVISANGDNEYGMIGRTSVPDLFDTFRTDGINYMEYVGAHASVYLAARAIMGPPPLGSHYRSGVLVA